MEDQLFSKELTRLRSLEERLIKVPAPLGAQLTGYILDAIPPLKESIYFFRAAENNNLKSNYKYESMKGDFPYIVEKIITIVNERPPQTIITSILSRASRFYDELTKLKANQTDDSQRLEAEMAEIRKQILVSRKELELVQRRAELAKEQTRQAKDAAESASQSAESASQAATAIAGDKISDEWTEEYRPYVNYDKKTQERVEKRIERASSTKKSFAKWCELQYARFIYRTLSVLRDRLFYSGKSYVNTVKKWSAWRSLWLAALLVVAIAYIVMFHGYDFNVHSVYDFLLAKSILVPLVVVISLGFLFSSRNYKINAHLLEQYRHRYVAARMMRSLLGLEELKDKSDLLKEGAKVLFEFRPSGYMNKVETETSFVPVMLEALPFASKTGKSK